MAAVGSSPRLAHCKLQHTANHSTLQTNGRAGLNRGTNKFECPQPEGTNASQQHSHQLPIATRLVYFHRKGAPPLLLMLPIVRGPRKDLALQFARVDDFAQSIGAVFEPELPDSVGFQAERAAKTA